MQAGQMDAYMKLSIPKSRLSKKQLGMFRHFFDAVDSFDDKNRWDPRSETTQHVRLLLKAEPQIGKTGDDDGAHRILLQLLLSLACLDPCMDGIFG